MFTDQMESHSRPSMSMYSDVGVVVTENAEHCHRLGGYNKKGDDQSRTKELG
jgi:hypothetical protein